MTRLFAFTTGSIACPLQGIKMNCFQRELFEMPVPWYAVDHPDALIVIDGGAPYGASYPGCRVRMYQSEACVPALRRLAFDLERPTIILQTHLHSDHVGALAALPEFTAPRIVVTRREYEYARRPDWHLASDYVRSYIDHPQADWSFVEDADDAVDLLGDGAIRLHHTPGHSVGHLAVAVTLPRTGTVLIVGDAAYTRDHWEERALPGLVASTIDAVRSVQKMRRLAAAHGAQVFFGHDMDQWAGEVRQAPAFYD